MFILMKRCSAWSSCSQETPTTAKNFPGTIANPATPLWPGIKRHLAGRRQDKINRAPAHL